MERRLDAFLTMVASLGHLDDAHATRRAAIAVLRALALLLPPSRAEPIFALLGEALADEQDEARAGPRAAVAHALGVDDARARAVSDAVLVSALEVLGPAAAEVFDALPEDVRPARRPDVSPDGPAVTYPTPARAAQTTLVAAHTLAGGRPGSEHPLADAPATRAHQHSVAASDDPHGDTRLSSATDPMAGHKLADGRPAGAA